MLFLALIQYEPRNRVTVVYSFEVLLPTEGTMKRERQDRLSLFSLPSAREGRGVFPVCPFPPSHVDG